MVLNQDNYIKILRSGFFFLIYNYFEKDFCFGFLISGQQIQGKYIRQVRQYISIRSRRNN